MAISRTAFANQFPIALVTGASSGIGKAVALELANLGVSVFGTSRNPGQPDLPMPVQWLAFDGASPQGIDAFCEHNRELLSKVCILVNNSGSSCFGKASSIPDEVFKGQHNLLVTAPIRMTQAVLGGMRERNSGAIVNVSSLAALFRLPYMEAYSDAKAELSAWTREQIVDERNKGLVIIDFQPGDYRTSFNSNMIRYGSPDEREERVWRHMEKNLRDAPPPGRAAADIIDAIRKGRSRTVRSGRFFQRALAPVGEKLLPEAALNWAIKRYYGIS